MSAGIAMFRPGVDSPSFARQLSRVRGVEALTLLDEGTKILTAESNGYVRRLAVYDIESGEQVFPSLILAPAVGAIHTLAVSADPDRAILNCTHEGHGVLQEVSLSTAEAVGPAIRLGDVRTNFLTIFGRKPDYFQTDCIGMRDGERRLTVRTGAYLAVVGLDRGSYEEGPVYTLHDIGSDPRNDDWKSNTAGVHRPYEREYFTGSSLGSIRAWSDVDLTLLRHWEVSVPARYERSGEHSVSRQIRAMAVSRRPYTWSQLTRLAAGTWAGTIHLFDADTGDSLAEPIVPATFDYGAAQAGSHSEEPQAVTALTFCGDVPLLAAGHEDGHLRLWDATRHGLVAESLPPTHYSAIDQLLWGAANRLVWRAGRAAGVWDVRAWIPQGA